MSGWSEDRQRNRRDSVDLARCALQAAGDDPNGSQPPSGLRLVTFFTRRLETAAAMLMLSLQEQPNWEPRLRFLASCYAHLGQLGDAQSIVEKLRQITPVLVPSAEHWRIREDREYYLDGLRLAVGVTPEKPAGH
jgi:hypothetical protein